MTNASAALDALGDPTRRRVLELLHTQERSVRELTEALPVTQSAVSQHLRVLRDAGLVEARAAGTRRIYRVDLDGLAPVRAYLDAFWDDVLGAFAAYATERSSHPDSEPSPTIEEPR